MTKTGIELITDERLRQINEEGYDYRHDDSHNRGELAGAAAWYAMNAINYVDTINLTATLKGKDHHTLWPWADEWYKPKTPLHDLIRAGALIAAEIDRLQRLKK